MRVLCLVNNEAAPGYLPEHGLSLWLEYAGHRLLFDTGGGLTLEANAARAGIEPAAAELLVFSHGHCDHTGGLAGLPGTLPVVAGAGFDAPCWSFHADDTRHPIGLTADSAAALAGRTLRLITGFTEILPGLWLTGRIPRKSGEDTGGRFFLDEAGTLAQTVPEELALLAADGTLITGCCHAGLLNTIACCRANRPEIRIRRIIGGLHLLHAGPERLAATVRGLRELDLEAVIPLHCSGAGTLPALLAAGLPARAGAAGEELI